MWNKVVELLKDPSYKQSGIAVCVSAILHALLFGGFDFKLPTLKKEMHLIEARILMPKAVSKQIDAPIQDEVITPKILPSELEQPRTEEPIEPTLPKEDVVVTETEPEILPPVETPQPIVKPESIEDESQQVEQAVDIGLVVNENAYPYVETDFDVRTEVDGGSVGKATIVYNLTEGNHYQLNWLTTGTGLAALMFPDLLQTSEGLLTKSGLQPVKYLYQFGNKTEKTRTANFDWQAKNVVMQTSKGIKREELPEGTQDLISFMYQFMYVTPLQNMQIPIATGKKLSTYEYNFEGEENFNSSLGELKAIHITYSGSDSDEKTELWLAIDYQYLPVKIRKIERNGNVVELEATRINTNRPTINK